MNDMVTLGVEAFLADRIGEYAGQRAGLITNPSGVDRQLRPTIDRLHGRDEFDLEVLFGPEHGIRGNEQTGVVGDRTDDKTGLPVRSITPERRQDITDSIADLDLVVYDIQDVGCRFYTFVYSLGNTLKAAAEADTDVVVLDRPNPIAPLSPAGGTVSTDAASVVGDYGLSIVHGMTVGELAQYFNDAFEIGASLDVVRMSGWERDRWYDDLDVPWVPPSPNMPTPQTAVLYPGTCLFEGTNLSEGRGTTRPFELVGAPWIDADEWANRLNEIDLAGVKFRPAYFTPMFSKHERESVEGVQVHVLDREAVSPSTVGLAMLATAFNTYPECDWIRTNGGYFIDKLAGSDRVRAEIDSGRADAGSVLDEIVERWAAEVESFERIREPYLLY